MQISVLIENTSDGSLRCEHGLSLLIEQDGRKILLDAGATDAFWYNAVDMGISIKDIDIAVLSHGHYDHSGGFAKLFENNQKVKLYMQKSAADSFWSGNGGLHEISMPEEVKKYRERFIFADGVFYIGENILLVPHKTKDLYRIGEKAKLYKKDEQGIQPDDFAHEQSLVFDTQQGLVILNSCSHGGVANIIREAKCACGGKPIYAYIGGLHMKGKKDGQEICTFSEEALDELCGVIKEEKIQVVYTGHCTGQQGMEKMKERLGDTVKALQTGLQIYCPEGVGKCEA